MLSLRQRQMSIRDIWRELCLSSMQAEQHQAELDKAGIGPQSIFSLRSVSFKISTCNCPKCPKAKKDQEAAAKQQAEEHEKEHLSCRTLWTKEKRSSSLDFCACSTDWLSPSHFTPLFLCHQSRRLSQWDDRSDSIIFWGRKTWRRLRQSEKQRPKRSLRHCTKRR